MSDDEKTQAHCEEPINDPPREGMIVNESSSDFLDELRTDAERDLTVALEEHEAADWIAAAEEYDARRLREEL